MYCKSDTPAPVCVELTIGGAGLCIHLDPSLISAVATIDLSNSGLDASHVRVDPLPSCGPAIRPAQNRGASTRPDLVILLELLSNSAPSHYN